MLHKTIKKIEEDTERFSFNTAVSTFMICVNELTDLKCHKKDILQPLLVLLAPYAPHVFADPDGNFPSIEGVQGISPGKHAGNFLFGHTFPFAAAFYIGHIFIYGGCLFGRFDAINQLVFGASTIKSTPKMVSGLVV